MSIKISLIGDQILDIQVDGEEWARAFKHAVESKGVIEVHSSDGRTLAINPQQIQFWEEVPEGLEQDQASRSRQAQPA
jgi:hypothetical protein